MDNARWTAQAISDGLNCLHRCATILADQSDEVPDLDSLEVFDAMERAFETTRAGTVTTDMVITDDHLAALRRIRTLVQQWIASGQGSSELVSLKDTLMKSLAHSEHSVQDTD